MIEITKVTKSDTFDVSMDIGKRFNHFRQLDQESKMQRF